MSIKSLLCAPDSSRSSEVQSKTDGSETEGLESGVMRPDQAWSSLKVIPPLLIIILTELIKDRHIRMQGSPPHPCLPTW